MRRRRADARGDGARRRDGLPLEPAPSADGLLSSLLVLPTRFALCQVRAAEQAAQGLAEGKVHSYETLATLNIETRVFAASDADTSSASSASSA